MNDDKLDQILEARAKSPTPVLEADPFLPTRVRAWVSAEKKRLFPGWRVSSLIGATALLIGVYIGNGVDNSVTSAQSYATTYDLSGTFYQESLSDDFNSIIAALDKGEKK